MRYIILILCLYSASIGFSQVNYKISDPIIISCTGLFQDSGGTTDDYQANEDFSSVICTDGTTGTHIKLTFSDVDLAIGDELCFFDGNDTSFPMLACASDFFNSYPFVVQATAANPSGCITVTFNTNSTVQAAGWSALIDCIPSCQLIQVALESSNPVSVPLDTGWVDVCIGDRITFAGKGIYPQSGLIYEHSDATATFDWDFGDGITAKGPNVSHAFRESGGFKVQLTVTDQFGCKSSNFITQRVRVSTKPSFALQGDFPTEICIGDTILLNGGSSENNDTSNIVVFTNEGSFQAKGIRSDSLALPDGNGTSYETNISFTDFLPGQTLDNVEDLKSICLNMEHSWLHDMEISISCPSGRKAILQQQVLINDEVFLGTPNDEDGINPLPGIGKDYCWTPDATLGTLTDVANRDNDSNIGEPYFLPEGVFNSHESLALLVGCPLNGEWTIKITDLWEQDNGWIFSWGIEFDPKLFPTLETYQPELIDFQWQDNNTIVDKFPEDKPKTILVAPTTPGTVSYTFESTDNYGCTSDTSIQINVLPRGHPDCLNCTDDLFSFSSISLCEGTSVNLGTYIKPEALGAITFENQVNYEFGNGNHPSNRPYQNPIVVSGVGAATISSSLEELISVCVDIESDFNADITLQLRAPSGNILTLSKQRGGHSDNYHNTCFSPKATIPIANGSGPFEGVYLPEDDWDKLVGETINGEWVLFAGDSNVPDEFNTFKSWSISFEGNENSTYRWQPGTNIDATIGLNPTLTANADTAPFYTLTKEDASGCISMDTLYVNIISADIPLDIAYYSLQDGEVLFYWSPIAGANTFEVSTNGGSDWMATDDAFFHREIGFANGETRSFLFRAVFEEQGCRSLPKEVFAQYLFCDLAARLEGPVPEVRCFGDNNATAIITATGGTAPYEFILDDTIQQTNGVFSNLSAGDYQVLIFDDGEVCADTINFTVGTPDSLGINFDGSKNVTCHNLEDGIVAATIFGGVGGYNDIQWTPDIGTTTTIDNLSSGSYIISASDANNCRVTDTIEITAPPALALTDTQKPVSCFGGTDGEAGVKVIGGMPPYRYQWNNDQTSSNATGLSIGNYQVTVTDANNCIDEIETTITQPSAITIDFTSSSISCAGEADAQIIANASGGTPPYKYIWGNGQSNKLNFNLGEGEYFVTVFDAQDCEISAVETITPTNSLLVNVIATAPFCQGEATGTATVNVTGGTEPYSYRWNDEQQQESKTVTNLAVGDYEVTVTDINACEQITTVQIEANNVIEISQGGVNASCHDKADGSINIVVEGGTGNYTYQWEDGQTTPQISNLLPGKYAFTISDGNQCAIVDTAIVASPPPLGIDSLNITPPLCNDITNGAINAFVSGGTTPYNYEWSNGQLQNPTLALAAGAYGLLVTDQRGCTISQNNILLENPSALQIATEKQDVLCFGENTGEAIAIPMGGVPPYSYKWSDAKNQKDSIATSLTEGTYMVTIEDSNACQETANVLIAQPLSALTVTLEQTEIGCFNDPQGEATITVMGGTGTNFQYNWSEDKGTRATANQLAGQTYFVTVSDENNCSLTESITITTLDSIAADILSTAPTCHNTEDGKLAVTTITGGNGAGEIDNYTLQWSNNATTQIIDSLAGNTTYTLTIRDQNNCSNRIPKFLSSPEEINLIATATDLACSDDNSGSITIEGTSDNSLIMTYDWQGDEGSFEGNTASNLAEGIYSVTATNEKGCGLTETFEIAQPTALIIERIQLTQNACNEDASGIIEVDIAGGIANYSYAWSNGSTEKDLQGVAAGNYALTITDNNDCEVVENFTLNNPENLTGNIAIENASCLGENNGRLELTPIGGIPPYQYSLDGNNFKNSPIFIGLSTGGYTTYVRDSKGCIWEERNVFIEDGPEFSLQLLLTSDNVALGDSAIIAVTYNNNQGAVQVNWNASTTESFDCLAENCERILVKPQTSTNFEVYAVDELGCEAETELFLRISNPKKIFVPTGFTPNNDGFNDILLVHGQSNIKVKYFRLFDRWGEEVFTALDFFVNDPNVLGWDGFFKGQAMNSGTFTWIMEVEYLDQQSELFRGSTTLMR